MKTLAKLLLLISLVSYVPAQAYTIVIKDKDGKNVLKEDRAKKKAEKAAKKAAEQKAKEQAEQEATK